MSGRTLALSAALLAAVACDAVTGLAGDCLAAVQVDGVVYIYMEELEDGAFTPGDHYATVDRKRACEDVIGDGADAPESFVDGDSYFLDAGTRLHEVPGYPAAERLAADVPGGWVLVSVERPVALFVEDGVQVALTLDAGAIVAPGTITARLEYAAVADATVTVSSSAGCPAFADVYDAGERIPFPATDYACTAAITTWAVEPGQPLQVEWPLEIGPDATPLEPGTYRFVADLLTHDRELELEFDVH